MRIWALGLMPLSGLLLLASACGGSRTAKETFDDLDKPIFQHPSTTNVTYSESVNTRDRQLVEFAVSIAQPMFAEAGFPLAAKFSVAGDENSFLQFYKTTFNASEEDAREAYTNTRGATKTYNAQVVINIPLHDAIAEGEKRDATLVFTVVHELYHVLQTRLSRGWNGLTDEPKWIGEGSANLAAWRAMISGTCVPLAEINKAIASLAQNSECTREFVDEQIFNFLLLTFFADQTTTVATQLYLHAEFGLEAYDRFYVALPEAAASFTAEINTLRDQLWRDALEDTFLAPSIESLQEKSTDYITEHEELLLKRLEEVHSTFKK